MKATNYFDAEDRVLRGFGDAEFHDALGLDLDGFAGLGIAAHAGGAVFEDELADAGQRESVLRVLVGERGEMVEDFAGLLFWRAAAFSATAAMSWDFESAFAICCPSC